MVPWGYRQIQDKKVLDIRRRQVLLDLTKTHGTTNWTLIAEDLPIVLKAMQRKIS